MESFAIVSSSTSEVAKALRVYLEEVVPSDFASLEIDAEKSYKWQVTGTIFVDLVALAVEVSVKTCDDEVSVSVTHTSRNDPIRFKSLLKQLIAFLQARGLQTSSNLPVSNAQPRMLDDDDFGFSDEEEEETAWEEIIQPVLQDARSLRREVREEAMRVIAQWASSSPASHEALARALVDCGTELSTLFRTSSHASSAETYPFAVAMRNVSQGCSAETRSKMLRSPLSTMMDPESKPCVPAVVAKEYKMAMQALGKVDVPAAVDDVSIYPEVATKDQVKTSGQFEYSKSHQVDPAPYAAHNNMVAALY
jgi:hypothetical protein